MVEENNLSFDSLVRVNTEKRKEILAYLMDENPDSISKISEDLDRNYSVVHRDLEKLSRAGLIKRGDGDSLFDINHSVIDIPKFRLEDFVVSGGKNFDDFGRSIVNLALKNHFSCVVLGSNNLDRRRILNLCSEAIPSNSKVGFIVKEKTGLIDKRWSVEGESLTDVINHKPEYIVDEKSVTSEKKDLFQFISSGHTVLTSDSSSDFSEFQRKMSELGVPDEHVKNLQYLLVEVSSNNIKIKYPSSSERLDIKSLEKFGKTEFLEDISSASGKNKEKLLDGFVDDCF